MAANIIIITLIVIAVGFAIRSLVNSSKSSGCGGCPYGAACSKCMPAQKIGEKKKKCACMPQNKS